MKNTKLKLKPIPKCLRESKRYLKAKILAEKNILLTEKDIFFLVQSNLKRISGLKGIAESNLNLISFDAKKQTAVFSCNASQQKLVEFSLLLSTNVLNSRISLNIINVSGTLKSLT